MNELNLTKTLLKKKLKFKTSFLERISLNFSLIIISLGLIYLLLYGLIKGTKDGFEINWFFNFALSTLIPLIVITILNYTKRNTGKLILISDCKPEQAINWTSRDSYFGKINKWNEGYISLRTKGTEPKSLFRDIYLVRDHEDNVYVSSISGSIKNGFHLLQLKSDNIESKNLAIRISQLAKRGNLDKPWPV